jgi:hypothetical protein
MRDLINFRRPAGLFLLSLLVAASTATAHSDLRGLVDLSYRGVIDNPTTRSGRHHTHPPDSRSGANRQATGSWFTQRAIPAIASKDK